MARYPERLLVGAKDDQRIVLLQPDRLLLLFEAGAEPQQIEESLERLELRADPATEAFPQPSVPLEARVVTVPEKRREALDGLARELLEYQDLPAALAAAMPVYQPVGGGRTQAISPVPGRLLVRFRIPVIRAEHTAP